MEFEIIEPMSLSAGIYDEIVRRARENAMRELSRAIVMSYVDCEPPTSAESKRALYADWSLTP